MEPASPSHSTGVTYKTGRCHSACNGSEKSCPAPSPPLPAVSVREAPLKGVSPSQRCRRMVQADRKWMPVKLIMVLGGYTSVCVCVHWALMVISFALKVILYSFDSLLVIFRIGELMKIFRVSRKPLHRLENSFQYFWISVPCLMDGVSAWVILSPAQHEVWIGL